MDKLRTRCRASARAVRTTATLTAAAVLVASYLVLVTVTAAGPAGELAEWSTVRQLAEWLQLPVSSVYWMNTAGTGPRRHHISGQVRYRRRDVEAWLKSREVAEAP